MPRPGSHPTTQRLRHPVVDRRVLAHFGFTDPALARFGQRRHPRRPRADVEPILRDLPSSRDLTAQSHTRPGIIGAGRSWTAWTISVLSMPRRYTDVIARRESPPTSVATATGSVTGQPRVARRPHGFPAAPSCRSRPVWGATGYHQTQLGPLNRVEHPAKSRRPQGLTLDLLGSLSLHGRSCASGARIEYPLRPKTTNERCHVLDQASPCSSCSTSISSTFAASTGNTSHIVAAKFPC